MLNDQTFILLESLIKEILLDEARKRKKRKAKKRKSSKKRPGRKDYYKKLNPKGKLEMEKEINRCSGKGKGKNWKRPKSCYDKEWEADKEKYRTKK